MAVIGTMVDGKYEILREIGRGGMSVVYLAMDTRLNKQWAIKEIERRANDANNDVVVNSLLAEANLMKKLDHPALPRIVDIIEEKNVIYVVMDYIEGEPLSKILELYGKQDQDTVIEWGKQLCDVLFYLHNCDPPIIYRDMKPANVMLKPDGTVKLIDFGIAREYKRSKNADTESLGTRGYAAPEQFGGKGQTDARTDIYCFGVTLYHLVTGKNPCEPPYELYPIKQIDPNYYDGLQYLIQKCIQMNPADRFQSCDEIRYVLDNIQEFDRGRRLNQSKKYKAFIAMAALSAAFLALGGGSMGLRSMAIRQSLNDNLAVFESSSPELSAVQNAMTNIEDSILKSVSSENKLKIYAEYYEALYLIANKDNSTLSTLNLETTPETCVDEVGDDADKYAAISDAERAYLAKSCLYQGALYYMQMTGSKSSVIGKAKDRFSYIVDDDKLGLASQKNTCDTGIFSADDMELAKALYAVSNCYNHYFEKKTDTKNFGIQDQSGEKNNASDKAMLDSLIAVADVFESDSISQTVKANAYYAFSSFLKDTAIIRSLKNSKVTAEQVDALYRIVYGESWNDVYQRGISTYGENITTTEAETISVPGNVTGGVNAMSGGSTLLSEVQKWRFPIANSIHSVYVVNAD